MQRNNLGMFMFYKKIIIIFALSVIFTTTANSADCKKIFEKIDKQNHDIVGQTGRERIKSLIAIEEDLFKAIDQCKKYSGMFVLMGEVQIDMGQVPLAVVYGRKAVELDSKYWRAYKLLGSARMLNQEIEFGLKALKQAHSLEPKNVKVQLNLIGAYIENKKYDEAFSLVNEIIKNKDDENLATAYYLRSRAYAGKGLIIEGSQDSKKAHELGFSAQQR